MGSMKKFMISAITIVSLFMWSNVPAFAHQEIVPGSGGGPSVPLYMRDVSIKDNETDVPVNTEIVLYYSHNVADETIQEANRQAISLKEDSGKEVDYEISFPTVFAYRQEIWILPKTLKPDTKYVITVSKDLMSRNGYTTGKEENITFTTESAAEAAKKKSAANESGSLKQDELMKQAKESGIVEETKEKKIKRTSDETAGRVEDTATPIIEFKFIAVGSTVIVLIVMGAILQIRKRKNWGE